MIDLTTVYQTYTTKRGKVNALAGIDLHIDAGEFVVVQGPSGCGKSTLLWTIGAMLRPTSGHVMVDGRDLYAQNAAERNCFRAEHIGFVFQTSHLLPYLSLRKNICLGQLHETSEDEVDTLLTRLGLTERSGHRPGELSIGEQQRAALARAIIKQPKLLLADEPTGNLDPANADEVLRVLLEFHESGGTVLLVTHGRDAEGLPGRIVRIESGCVVDGENHE